MPGPYMPPQKFLTVSFEGAKVTPKEASLGC